MAFLLSLFSYGFFALDVFHISENDVFSKEKGDVHLWGFAATLCMSVHIQAV